MVFGDAFFSESLDNAIHEMKRLSKCDVRRCAFPSFGKLSYYISEHGTYLVFNKLKVNS